jgi:hypothetical protein
LYFTKNSFTGFLHEICCISGGVIGKVGVGHELVVNDFDQKSPKRTITADGGFEVRITFLYCKTHETKL